MASLQQHHNNMRERNKIWCSYNRIWSTSARTIWQCTMHQWRTFGWGLCNNLGHIATKDATISDENYYFGISMEEITTASCCFAITCKYVLHDDQEGWEEVIAIWCSRQLPDLIVRFTSREGTCKCVGISVLLVNTGGLWNLLNNECIISGQYRDNFML